MATVNLNATARVPHGKGGARKVRATGQIPAVIYRAGTAAHSITLDPAALELAFQRTKDPNTLVAVDVEGRVLTCLVRDTQRHPVSHVLRHVDFYEVDKAELVDVVVPLRIVGTSVGVKAGGKLKQTRRELPVTVAAGSIPSTIDVDISPLEIGQKITVSDIKLADGAVVRFSHDFDLIEILAARSADAAKA
jgi:large subunit ribosomal protein L25